MNIHLRILTAVQTASSIKYKTSRQDILFENS